MESNISSSIKECLGVQNDVGDAAATAVKLTKSQKRNRLKRLQKKREANLEQIDKPKDMETPLINSLAVDQMITVSSTGESKPLVSGTENGESNGATKLTKSQKRNRREKLKKMENDGGSTNHNVNGTEEKDNKSNLSQSLNPQYTEDLKINTSATGTTGLKMKKRKKNDDKNPDVGTTRVLETINAEMVPGKSEIPVESLIATTNLNGNGIEQKNGKRKSMNDRTNLVEVMNPQDLQDVVCENGETGSDKTATGLKKRKKMKEKDVVSGGVLSTREGPQQDTVITNKGSSERKKMKEKDVVSGGVLSTREGPPQDTVISNKVVENPTSHVAPLRKKLLIMDVNGLLADIVRDPPQGIKADRYMLRRAIFKRPFLNDFLGFCFERFHVSIWSSRARKNLDPVIDFLLGDLKEKLLFCWDSSKCTNAGVRTLENNQKWLVFKDLSKIWDKNGPCTSWIKRSFDESNTLLLDDSPYKALLNNKHTGIFPVSYSYLDKDDDFLGPKGKLRMYLEGLADADDVKTYVEQHPLGQVAINENSPDWDFYSPLLSKVKIGNSS